MNGHTSADAPTPTPTPSVYTRPADETTAAHALLPSASQYRAHGNIPNTPLAASVISALLGGLLFASLALASQTLLKRVGLQDWTWARGQLGLYLATLGLFHLLEFWTTAGWNPKKLTVDAFLLNNGSSYWASHALGLIEYFLSSYFWPKKFESSFSSYPVLVGAILAILAAQALRSIAMIQASVSFSHMVKAVKHDDHTLITHGVYAWSRHPSYCGFFYWAVATQILLGNVFSTAAFVIILGRFFSQRIKVEEIYLVKFFGNDYVEYRKRVGTGVPFVITS